MGRVSVWVASILLAAALSACADSETERLSQLRAETARAAGTEADGLNATCRRGDTHACDQVAYYRSVAASQAAMAEEEHQTAVAEGRQRAAVAIAIIGAAAAAGAAAARPPQPIYVIPAPSTGMATHCTSFVTGSFLNTNCY